MSRMSDYLEGQIRTHLFRTGTFTKPTKLAISLHSADPGETGASELDAGVGGYKRATLPPLDANWAAPSGTDGEVHNGVAITDYPTPTAAWGTVTYFGIWDSTTTGGGNFLIGGALTNPKTINNGDPAPTWATCALSVTFA